LGGTVASAALRERQVSQRERGRTVGTYSTAKKNPRVTPSKKNRRATEIDTGLKGPGIQEVRRQQQTPALGGNWGLYRVLLKR